MRKLIFYSVLISMSFSLFGQELSTKTNTRYLEQWQGNETFEYYLENGNEIKNGSYEYDL